MLAPTPTEMDNPVRTRGWGAIARIGSVLRVEMRTPNHSTIAEFRRRHVLEIGELFDDVLGVCREAGLVSVG